MISSFIYKHMKRVDNRWKRVWLATQIVLSVISLHVFSRFLFDYVCDSSSLWRFIFSYTARDEVKMKEFVSQNQGVVYVFSWLPWNVMKGETSLSLWLWAKSSSEPTFKFYISIFIVPVFTQGFAYLIILVKHKFGVWPLSRHVKLTWDVYVFSCFQYFTWNNFTVAFLRGVFQ